MMDLVINHTAKDSVLASEHPEWFLRDPGGELRSPRAIDPVDPRKFTVWGDLAEIDYHNLDVRAAQIAYWVKLVRHHLDLGFNGFRCDAAYQVPAEVWQGIIGAAKAKAPGCRFFAETLGCTPEQVLGLKDAGFDFLFNSAKWWDFRSPWLLEQYDLYRQVAPTVAFPESHDTERLAMALGDPEPDELERRYRFHYLFAATFSSGVMMPMGFEFGCRKPMDVVGSRPGDWTWETANAAHRPHRLHRRGQPHEGGDAGAQRRGSADADHRAAPADHRPAPPFRRRSRGLGGRRDRADQRRSGATVGDRSGTADQSVRRPDQPVRGRDAGAAAGSRSSRAGRSAWSHCRCGYSAAMPRR